MTDGEAVAPRLFDQEGLSQPDLSALPVPIREFLNQANIPSQAVVQVMSMFAAYSGPLPSPEQLAGYERVLPGSADRILKMAEGQATHRQDIEKVAVRGGARRSWWGLWLGFVISVIVVVLGTIMVLEGYQVGGSVIIGVDVVALSSVFVIGRVDQRRERTTKDAQTHTPLPGGTGSS